MPIRTEASPIFTRATSTISHTGVFLKACLLIALIVPLLALSQAARAQSEPLLSLNTGLNDAWFNPATNGQGFFIVVYPDIPLVFLAWFTYDTERPDDDTFANLGEPGHRWITAQGGFVGTRAELDIIVTSGGVFDQSLPEPVNDSAGTMVLEFENCAAGTVTYDMPSLGLSGEIPIQRIAPDNVALCEALAASACQRAEPDLSHGRNNPPIVDGAIIPTDEVVDGGPGPDGIPPIEFPMFSPDIGSAPVGDNDLVVGVKYGENIRAYPHDILNWHEVINDDFFINDEFYFFTLTYCPLTGSAMFWKATTEPVNKTYGTSGFLFNANLIMYDRATQSFWSQMLEQSVAGTKILEIPDRVQVVETTWSTWQAMYPETLVLTRNTGISRDYDDYPYGSFRTDNNLIFPANNSNDNRLHRKERVLGINVGSNSKVYPIKNFTNKVEIINENVGNMSVVVAGSRDHNLGVVYNRELEDCTVLEFEAVQDSLPVVMRDNEGTEWDVFGHAVSGPRSGQKLQKTNSYIAYWYAWTAFFEGAEINE